MKKINMGNKPNTIVNSIYMQSNDMVTIVGRDMGAVSAQQVQALIDFNSIEGEHIFNSALENGTYIKFITDKSKIKTLVIMDNGNIYPSTFNLSTLMKRISEASALNQ